MNAAPHFPDTIWDGLSYQFTSLDIDKNPDFFWKDQVRAEIVAIENYLTKHFFIYNFQESAEEGNIVASYQDPLILGSSQEESRIHVIGLADEFIPAGCIGRVQTVGIKQLNNWYPIIGQELLEPGTTYYAAENGKMTSQIPQFGWLIKVGRALTETHFLINIQEPIRL